MSDQDDERPEGVPQQAGDEKVHQPASAAVGAPIPDAVRPVRRVGRRRSGEADEAVVEHTLSSAEPAGLHGAESYSAGHEPESKFAEFQVSALFVLAALGVVGFCAGYFGIGVHDRLGGPSNWALGS